MYDEKEAENGDPKNGVFFNEEEEKGFGDGVVRNSEEEWPCIAISAENGGFLLLSVASHSISRVIYTTAFAEDKIVQ